MSKNTVIMLTYKGHVDKQEFRFWLRAQFPKHNNMKIAIAHETGDKECEYLHTHVVVHLGKSTTISKKRVESGLNYPGPWAEYAPYNEHPNVKGMKGRSAWKDGLIYISKEDTDIGHEISEEEVFSGIVDLIWDQDTLQDVYRNVCKSSKDVLAFKEIFKAKARAGRIVEYHNEFRDGELNEYQIEWWKRLQAQNRRRILWIYDPSGNKGKTWFSIWLHVVHGARKLVLTSKAVNFQYDGEEYVTVDLVRSQEEYVSYQALEEVKNGYMVSSKYEGRHEALPPPKLIVFSNFHPEMEKMTQDRWEIVRYD